MTYLIIFLQKPSGNGLVGDSGRAYGVLQGQARVTDTELISAVVKGQPCREGCGGGRSQSLSPTAYTLEGHPASSFLSRSLSAPRLRDPVEVKVLCEHEARGMQRGYLQSLCAYPGKHLWSYLA